MLSVKISTVLNQKIRYILKKVKIMAINNAGILILSNVKKKFWILEQ